jgi:hypothetical protein
VEHDSADAVGRAGVLAARRWRRGLGALVAVALALRLGWGLVQGADGSFLDKVPEQHQYLEMARSVLRGEGLRFYDERLGTHLYAFRMPGYPLALAACGANVRVARALQALVDTSTVLAVVLLARALAGGSRHVVWPLAAGALVAVNPWLVRFTALILPETLFAAMLAWGMLLVVARGRHDTSGPPSWRATLRWLCGGMLLALSTLVRPGIAGLPVLLGLTAVLVNRPRVPAYQVAAESSLAPPTSTAPLLPYHPRWPLPAGTTLLLLTLLALSPWAYRNARTVGRWVWTTTSSGFSAYEAASVDADGRPEPQFPEAMPQLSAMNEVDRSVYLWNLAAERFDERRGRLLPRAAAEAARLWMPYAEPALPGPPGDDLADDSDRRDHDGAVDRFGAVAAWAYVLPFQVLLLLGLVKGGLAPAAKVFLLLPAIYITPVHLLTGAPARDRTPVEPPMAVLAASVLGLPSTAWKRAR